MLRQSGKAMAREAGVVGGDATSASKTGKEDEQLLPVWLKENEEARKECAVPYINTGHRHPSQEHQVVSSELHTVYYVFHRHCASGRAQYAR